MTKKSQFDLTTVYIVVGFFLAWHYNSIWSFGLYLTGALGIMVFFTARIWEAVTRAERHLRKKMLEYARPPKNIRF